MSRRAGLARRLGDYQRPLPGELLFLSDRVCRDVHLGERSAGSFLEHLEVPDRVPMVLPLLLEDHMQALQHSVVLARVTRAGGRDAVPLQLLRRRAGDHFAYLVLRSRRRSSTWPSEGPASGSMPQRRGLVSHDPSRPHGWYGRAIPCTIRRSQQSVASTR
jgi:hypothetical protein